MKQVGESESLGGGALQFQEEWGGGGAEKKIRKEARRARIAKKVNFFLL